MIMDLQNLTSTLLDLSAGSAGIQNFSLKQSRIRKFYRVWSEFGSGSKIYVKIVICPAKDTGLMIFFKPGSSPAQATNFESQWSCKSQIMNVHFFCLHFHNRYICQQHCISAEMQTKSTCAHLCFSRKYIFPVGFEPGLCCTLWLLKGYLLQKSIFPDVYKLCSDFGKNQWKARPMTTDCWKKIYFNTWLCLRGGRSWSTAPTPVLNIAKYI